MPIDSVGDPFAEISSEASGLCGLPARRFELQRLASQLDRNWSRRQLAHAHRAGFFRVWFGNSKKS
jgi:hypothetical protein